MDTESLKSLEWLLIWGGPFYVMMRYDTTMTDTERAVAVKPMIRCAA